MYSDTHCHIKYLAEEDESNAIKIIAGLATKKMPFVNDIGTISNDLTYRVTLIDSLIKELTVSDENGQELANRARNMVYFSAGIWPSVQEIQSRAESICKLEEQIDIFRENACGSSFSKQHLIGLGECGLDHHWNPSGVEGRNSDDFNDSIVNAEIELFEMQLQLAKKKNLPVIIHSREAFDETLSCIKNIGYHRGIIHCYSYGIEEAKKFLDLGWYISFSGSITYTKKRDLNMIAELIGYIPRDRMLCETDSPYLAPVPFRGKSNNPILVEYVYKFVAERMGITPEELAQLVYANSCDLFRLQPSIPG